MRTSAYRPDHRYDNFPENDARKQENDLRAEHRDASKAVVQIRQLIADYVIDNLYIMTAQPFLDDLVRMHERYTEARNAVVEIERRMRDGDTLAVDG